MGILARRRASVLERLLTPALLLFLLVTNLHLAYGAERQMPDILRNVGFDQRLNAQVPLDLQFTDETGRVVKLGDYFAKKPVVMVLAYYRCSMLCTVVLNGLVQAMRNLPLTVGREFNVVTISFDPRETAALAAAKKKTYVGRYGRPGAAEGWHFLTGKPEAIKRLTAAVGFRYVYDAIEGQYIHTSGTMILTPQGKISRYFYGVQLPRPRPAAGAAGSVGQQDRPADGAGPALLFPLRPGRRQILGTDPEPGANRRRADGRRAGRHGLVLVATRTSQGVTRK